MKVRCVDFKKYWKFTFQYGSIQIMDFSIKDRSSYYLHSNMVLFKFTCWCNIQLWICIYIPIWFYSNYLEDEDKYEIVEFTFQYGSIQMRSKLFNALPSTSFTFQYGSIQIKGYIPTFNNLIKFTFQYGSIQIKRIWVKNFLKMNLHSNMVLFK